MCKHAPMAANGTISPSIKAAMRTKSVLSGLINKHIRTKKEKTEQYTQKIQKCKFEVYCIVFSLITGLKCSNAANHIEHSNVNTLPM